MTPNQLGEMHHKALGTTESDAGLASSQRENSCAEEVNSLAQDLAARLLSEAAIRGAKGLRKSGRDSV